MAQTKFYRGVGSATSLPETRHDGSIYIIDTNNNPTGDFDIGEMFVDIGSRRLRISPLASAANLEIYTETEILTINNQTSTRGLIYLIVSDTNGDELGYKIGDGKAFIVDLPFIAILTTQDKNNLLALVNNSISASYGDSIDNSGDGRLILSKVI